MSDPSAEYKCKGVKIEEFTTSSRSQHTTKGRTTGPSEFVIKAGMVDRDGPSEPKNTYLGHLRAKVTTLQDDINEYLTKRMDEGQKEVKAEKTKEEEDEIEKRVLDGDDEEDE